MTNLTTLEKALQIAVNAHLGQKDKAGKPYIFHPLRVMNQVATTDEKIVAILHDVLEDTNLTSPDLLKEGIPAYLVDAIVSLSKDEKETYEEFIRRVSWNQIAVAVKIADIKDNLDVSRLSVIVEEDINRLKRYLKALEFLGKDKK